DTVVQALINDGWEITDDPLVLSYGGRELYVDLGAEKTT
ncbi:MAG: fatty-acid oxidation protein subunit alpha, partial [Methylacidiphilales bacterium]|nr:fatty-acid oxidation protein subunit alpha [Candidatus Methylacidiphilales bacterium]